MPRPRVRQPIRPLDAQRLLRKPGVQILYSAARERLPCMRLLQEARVVTFKFPRVARLASRTVIATRLSRLAAGGTRCVINSIVFRECQQTSSVLSRRRGAMTDKTPLN